MSLKSVERISSAKADLREFPDEVQDALGFALYRVQLGQMPENAKPLQGSLRDVVELRENDPSGTIAWCIR
ncbi:MAG TPA: type II toxin-antitoxin system RelE/ParE family toxin [Candidatus Baltobacteraceae bacterium]|jgi:phage-related protein|nr:type II toxin-antitoxin system RelE/ParE family toxin [Candidatus Baltobacteraceae bacterium]